MFTDVGLCGVVGRLGVWVGVVDVFGGLVFGVVGGYLAILLAGWGWYNIVLWGLVWDWFWLWFFWGGWFWVFVFGWAEF